jgi:hypothetical protein
MSILPNVAHPTPEIVKTVHIHQVHGGVFVVCDSDYTDEDFDAAIKAAGLAEAVLQPQNCLLTHQGRFAWYYETP